MAEIDELLRAEEAIQQLLSELEALKAQVGHYSAAKQSLQDATESLRSLVDKTSVVAERAHNTFTELGRIGTPEILAQIGDTKQSVASSSTEVKQAILSGASELSTGLARLRRLTVRFGIIAVASMLLSIGILVRLIFH